MASLSAFLRRMRGKRTQKEVAAGIGIDRSAYVNMENERRGMGEDVAKRLAAYYKKPLKTFSPYITDDAYRLKLIEGTSPRRAQAEDEQYESLTRRIDVLEEQLRELQALLLGLQAEQHGPAEELDVHRAATPG